jgi:serpin B
MALTMAAVGADGSTALELAEALELNRLGDSWSSVYKYITDRMSAYASAFDVANALVIGSEFFPYVYPEYREFLKRQFRAEIFDSAPAVNSWVATLTHGRIKDLLDDSAAREISLVNAVYLKLPWKNAFMKHKTYQGTFRAQTPRPCRMMTQTAKLFYAETDLYQAVYLPYQTDSESSLGALVVLPRRVDGLDMLVQALPEEYFGSLAKLAYCGSGERKLGAYKKVELHLPKFAVEFSAQLGGSILQTPTAFSEAADFGKIVRGIPIQIQRVAHKTFVQVDESGTEAAAATAVSFNFCSTTVEVTPIMRVDHPFVFMVVDARAKDVLFAGTVHAVAEV